MRCRESQTRGRARRRRKQAAEKQGLIKGFSIGKPHRPQTPIRPAKRRHMPCQCPCRPSKRQRTRIHRAQQRHFAGVTVNTFATRDSFAGSSLAQSACRKNESLFPVDHGIPQKSATIRTAGWAFARPVVVSLIRLPAKGVTSFHHSESQPVSLEREPMTSIRDCPRRAAFSPVTAGFPSPRTRNVAKGTGRLRLVFPRSARTETRSIQFKYLNLQRFLTCGFAPSKCDPKATCPTKHDLRTLCAL